MKKILDITQKFLSLLMVLLSALAVSKGNIGIAIYLVLVALYAENIIDTTIIISKEGDKENE